MIRFVCIGNNMHNSDSAKVQQIILFRSLFFNTNNWIQKKNVAYSNNASTLLLKYYNKKIISS